MAQSTFVYTTYIRTTPQKLWKALTTAEFQRVYFGGVHYETDWKVGSPWKMIYPDGTLTDTGTIVEAKPPKRLVLRWRNEWMPKMKAEGFSRCVMELAPMAGAVKLTITHTMDRPKSKLIQAVVGGWPFVISNLKSYLETGKVVYKRFPK